jgi:AIR synthase-related protein
MSTLPFPVDLPALCDRLRASRGFAHKRDIHAVLQRLQAHLPGGLDAMAQQVAVGDDCAVIAPPGGGGGHLLFAIEGLVDDFVAARPWFAGYSAVMVNLSDVAAMGGRPLAVVDALWSLPGDTADALLAGMAAAAQRYGVPLVGGHSNLHSPRPQLAVAVLGHAQRLITSFDARPGDTLLMAVDLRGRYEAPYPFWNASTEAPPERLQADLALLPALAEAGLCDAGKDISMAGVLGTALMLLECSGVGADLDLSALPRPAEVVDQASLQQWLQAFPSFGFVLSVRAAQVAAVQARFHARGLACAAIGQVHPRPTVTLRHGARTQPLWDLREQPFITAGPAEAVHA